MMVDWARRGACSVVGYIFRYCSVVACGSGGHTRILRALEGHATCYWNKTMSRCATGLQCAAARLSAPTVSLLSCPFLCCGSERRVRFVASYGLLWPPLASSGPFLLHQSYLQVDIFYNISSPSFKYAFPRSEFVACIPLIGTHLRFPAFPTFPLLSRYLAEGFNSTLERLSLDKNGPRLAAIKTGLGLDAEPRLLSRRSMQLCFVLIVSVLFTGMLCSNTLRRSDQDC
jgi:hypothetical protein